MLLILRQAHYLFFLEGPGFGDTNTAFLGGGFTVTGGFFGAGGGADARVGAGAGTGSDGFSYYFNKE